MSNKLDDQGLLTDEAILGIDDGLCHDTIFLDKLVDWEAEKYAIKKYLTAERDELISMFEAWILADDDGFRMADRLRDRVMAMKAKSKTPPDEHNTEGG